MANKLYKPLLIDSIKAPVDLEKQRFIGFDGDYCSAGAKALGIVDVSTEKGQHAPYSPLGILLIQVGGTISAGQEVASDENGKAIVVTASAKINGIAMDSGNSGEVIRIIRGI